MLRFPNIHEFVSHLKRFGWLQRLAVFGVLAGYYIVYAIGLVRWRSRVLRAKRERESEPGSV